MPVQNFKRRKKRKEKMITQKIQKVFPRPEKKEAMIKNF